MTDSAEICDALLVSLRKVIRAIDLHSKQLVRQYGLTGPQMMVLKIVCHAGGKQVTNSVIAEEVSLSQATVTSILDRLVEKGYASREKSLADKRKTIVRATAKASKIFKQNPMLLQEDFIHEFERLMRWEQLAILSSVERIAAMMNAQSLDAAPVLANEEFVIAKLD